MSLARRQAYMYNGEKMCIVEMLVRLLPAYLRGCVPHLFLEPLARPTAAFMGALHRDMYKLRAFMDVMCMEDMGVKTWTEMGGFAVYANPHLRIPQIPLVCSAPELASWTDDVVYALHTQTADPHCDAFLTRVADYIHSVVYDCRELNFARCRKPKVEEVCARMTEHAYRLARGSAAPPLPPFRS